MNDKQKVLELIDSPRVKKIFVQTWFAGNEHTVRLTKAEALKLVKSVDDRSRIKTVRRLKLSKGELWLN